MVHGKYIKVLALGSILALTACGGGGSSSSNSVDDSSGGDGGGSTSYTIGGTITENTNVVTLSLNGTEQGFSASPFTFTDTVDAGESYSVAVVTPPAGQTCTVANGSGTASANITTVAVTCTDDSVAGGDYICRDHVTTQHNVVGNNVYEFIASDGECFGTVQDFGLVKQEIPITLDPASENTGFYTISANAKLTSEQVGYIPPSGGYNLYIVFDITNTSPDTICVDADEVSLRDNTDTELAAFSTIETLGDIFNEGGDYHNDCIPAGETRSLWASEAVSHDGFIAGQQTLPVAEFATLDHITIDIEADVYTAGIGGTRFADPISASQAIWDSEDNGGGQYGYTITNTFLNMTANQVYFRRDNVDVIYFDEDGYVVFGSISEISEFLDIDDNDLTDSDYLLTASGGTLSVQDHYTPIVPASGTTNIVGRAAKVVMHLEACDQASSQNLCDLFY